MRLEISRSIALLCSFFGFLVFSFFVFSGHLARFDLIATKYLQALIGHIFDLPFSTLSLLASFEACTITLAFISQYVFRRDLKKVFVVFLFYALGMLVELTSKTYILHPGPPHIFFRSVGLFFPSSYVHTNFSYPSGHIFRVTFIVLFMLLAFPQISKNSLFKVGIVIFLILMAISRIYLGEHWFTDVIGGFLLGLFMSLALKLFIHFAK